MKLTAKGRYAVMAMADLASQCAGHAGKRVPVSLSEIAARQAISQIYLEQIFVSLRKAGLVESQRGPGGGYCLTAKPALVTLDKVIAAVDEDIRARAHACTLETKQSCTGQNAQCLTHNLWDALEGHIEGFLASVTLADVISDNFPPLLGQAS
ncbi:MAG: Rrf2 family transcriptional regulator [Robiginitomaculum sp.]